MDFSMQRFSPSKWICAHAESSEEDEDYSIFSRFWIYAFSGSKKRKTWIRKFLGYFQENGNSITFLCSYEDWPLSSWNISILHHPKSFLVWKPLESILLENYKKSHCELRTFTFWVNKKFIKNSQKWSIRRVFDKLRVSVKQRYQTRQF